MPDYGVSILKRVAYRGGVQHFSNTYYYRTADPNTATGELEALVDAVVAKERVIHGGDVTFVKGRLWSADGTPAQNTMIVEKDLTGVGSAANDASMDRERCILIQISAGVDSRGRPVRLKKWFHINGVIQGVVATPGQRAQTAQLTAAQRAYYAGIGNDFRNLNYSLGSVAELIAKSGRQTTGPAATHPWLEHHQLGEEWRG